MKCSLNPLRKCSNNVLSCENRFLNKSHFCTIARFVASVVYLCMCVCVHCTKCLMHSKYKSFLCVTVWLNSRVCIHNHNHRWNLNSFIRLTFLHCIRSINSEFKDSSSLYFTWLTWKKGRKSFLKIKKKKFQFFPNYPLYT